MNEIISGSIARERFQAVLLSIFAGFALLLSVVGVYGLLSYTVTRRTNELGIRMALGADRRSLLAMVLREGGTLVGIGLIVGVVCALLITRTLASLLYGIGASDPGSFMAVIFLFAAAALLGCYLPARRAANIDPNVALRYQ